MQILSKTLKMTGTEKQDILIGTSLKEQNVVFVLENKGPATIGIKGIGKLPAHRFVVIGGVDELTVHPPSQLNSLDLTVFTA